MNSNAVKRHPDFTPQHRNESTSERNKDYSKEEIYEGQIMMTEKNIHTFDKFLTDVKNLKSQIIEQYRKLNSN